MKVVILLRNSGAIRAHVCVSDDPVDEAIEVALKWCQEVGDTDLAVAQDNLLDNLQHSPRLEYKVQILEASK